LEETLAEWISQYGYAGISFLLMFGIIGLPIPDETLLTLSGYLVFKGKLDAAPTIVSAFLGSTCGITISYLLGRSGGYVLIARYGHWVHITREKLERVHEWLEHRGRWGLFFGYFIPGVRHLAALVAGTSRMRYSIFAPYAYSGGLVWATLFISAGYFLGKEWLEVSALIKQWSLLALALAGCALVVYYLVQRKARRNT
jgi:membrane protein DedA with SNARE-associated domain